MLIEDMHVKRKGSDLLRPYLEFLASLPLDKKLRQIKYLEDDLKGDLNPSKLLDVLFFEQQQWLDFEAFFQLYVEKNQRLLQHTFPQLDEQQLLQGLRARLYRTQCGILTEYQAFLAAQVVFGAEHVRRSLSLDQAGVDFTIAHQQLAYHIHIFVDTQRAWQYRKYKSTHKRVDAMPGIHVNFPYALESGKINSLHYLPNGFGVYTPAYLRYLQNEIYAGNLQQQKVSGVNEEGFIYRSIS